MLSLMFYAAAFPEWLTENVGSVLVGQFVIGLITLAGFYWQTTRFMSKEFPAAMAIVTEKLENLHRDFEKLRDDLRAVQIQQAVQQVRLDNLNDRRDPDDTAARRRTPRS